LRTTSLKENSLVFSGWLRTAVVLVALTKQKFQQTDVPLACSYGFQNYGSVMAQLSQFN